MTTDPIETEEKTPVRDILRACEALGWLIQTTNDDFYDLPGARERATGILLAIVQRLVAQGELDARGEVHRGMRLVWEADPGQWSDYPDADRASLWSMSMALVLNLVREHLLHVVPEGRQQGDQDVTVAFALLSASAEAVLVALPGPMAVDAQRKLRQGMRTQIAAIAKALVAVPAPGPGTTPG